MNRCEVIMVKKGFSLAETLVAIFIIGILAIILIPIMTKDNPSKSKVIFRKSYNTLAQVVLNMINDDVNYPAAKFDTNGVPQGFNYTTATTNKDASNTYNKFCYFLSSQLNTVGDVTCPLNDSTATTTTRIFTMPDGSVWYFKPGGNDTTTAGSQFPMPAATPPATYYATYVTIDIDGPYKGNNCSADDSFSGDFMPTGVTPAPSSPYRKCISANPSTTTTPCENNPDTFILGVRYDGKIYTGTEAGKDYCAMDILRNPTNNAK